MGSSGTKLELLETSLAAVRLDGRMVTSPLGLQGAKLTAAVFNVVVADQYLRVVKTVAERLGLEILAVASTWQALASAMPEKEGICLDVGGRATDLTLVRNGKAWSTASVPLGGREFTRELVTTFELSDADAERLKVAYSLGQLDPRVNDQVRSAMVQQLEEWAKAVDASLVELCGSDEPPRHFRLCGGSSVLPDIAEVVRSYPWTRTLDRSRHPEVRLMRPSEIPHVLDRTGSLSDQRHVCPMAAAGHAMGRTHETAAWKPLLWAVKRPPTFAHTGGRS